MKEWGKCTKLVIKLNISLEVNQFLQIRHHQSNEKLNPLKDIALKPCGVYFCQRSLNRIVPISMTVNILWQLVVIDYIFHLKSDVDV